jgi:gluconolactonase
MGSDGMTIDEKGNIYLTGNGVTIYNRDGILLEHIDVPEEWTANITFGGIHHDKLFITASKSVYTLQMKVKGVQ